MPRRRLVTHRLVAVFLLGTVLFNYPLLAVFGHFGDIAGLPGQFAWLMLAWAGLIALMAAVVEQSDGKER